MSRNRRNAFTLIEVLIVVIIMAVLAATIIPQFSSSTKDAKDSSLKFNLQTMRSQIERYKFDHNGNPPTLAGFVDQMTKCTKSDGTDPVAKPDTSHFGPYLESIPTNSFNGKNGVTGCSGKPSGESAPETNGWQYDESTGRIYANTEGYFDL